MSVKSAPWVKERGYEELTVAPADDISKNNACYSTAIQNLGTTHNNTE